MTFITTLARTVLFSYLNRTKQPFIGNDGNMYIIETDKNGTKKWKKYIKENHNRPSPAKSATIFKEGTKKKETMETCIL